MPEYVRAPEPVDVQRYAGRESGKPAWVICSGPSLLHQPPGEMSGGVMIATNQNVNAHSRLGMPRADYWVTGDVAVSQLWKAGKLDVHPHTQKWFAYPGVAYLLGWGKTPADTEAGELGTGDSFITWHPNQGNMIAKTLPSLWCASRITNAAVSLAWVLGCDPIHIRGVDHGCDSRGRLHWWDIPGADEHPSLAQYEESFIRGKKTLRTLLGAIQRDGVTITVEGDKSVLEDL